MLRAARRGLAMLCLAASICVSGATVAADLKIGFKAEVTSADPHVLNGANRNIWAHVYDSLVAQDHQLRPKPSLALSWRMVNPTTWEFKLRPNVKFTNGAALTADDVKYSIDRAMGLSGPRTFRSYLKDVESVSVTGPLLLQVKTKRVSPTLPENVGLIAILPKSLGDTVNEESFANGKSAIGSGPYKFATWAHGQSLTLAKNPDYWGDKEPWDKVTFQFIPREPARAAALLSNSVDIINDITSNMEASFRNYQLASITSYMLNYLALDQSRDVSPYIKGDDDKPLAKNPLKNPKVRQALMTAINRDGIIKFLMKDDATAAIQLVPKGFFGYDPALKLPAYDLAKAKALLAEAGYQSGFNLTIHCPNNRYINDAKLCEAVAQVFSQIGIKTGVSTMPYSVFQTRAFGGGPNGEPEFSVFLVGNGAVTGDSLTGLVSSVHSFDKAKVTGVSNYGRYSNKEVDDLIDKAAATTDEKAREQLQQKAASLALNDGAIIPLLHLNSAWAMKKTLTITPRADGFTMAMDIRPK
nr:ABC transporter substrate-binding protein [Herbaspirillum sp. YR522]